MHSIAAVRTGVEFSPVRVYVVYRFSLFPEHASQRRRRRLSAVDVRLRLPSLFCLVISLPIVNVVNFYTYDPLRRQLRLSYYYYYYYYYYLYPDLPSSVGQELRGSTDAHTRSAVEMSGTVQKNFNTDRLACYIPENTQQTSLLALNPTICFV